MGHNKDATPNQTLRRQRRDFPNSEVFASDSTFEPLSAADLAIANFTLRNNVRL